MDKNTLSTYGWIIVTVIILLIMLAFATPFAKQMVITINGLLSDIPESFDSETGAGSEENNEATLTLPHEHNYISSTIKEASCTEAGTLQYECSCGDSYTEAIPMTGHIAGDTWQYNGASHWHLCEACGEELDQAEHTPNIDNATETENKICTVCTYIIEASLSHTHSYSLASSISASCEFGGYATYKCGCGDTYTIQTEEALGHNPGSSATCTTNQTCTRCSEVLVLAPGHTPGADATCTENQSCTVCGEILATALGHSYGIVIVAPTCTEQGYSQKKCSSCGNVKDTGDYVDALGHNYIVETDIVLDDNNNVIPEQSTVKGTCQRCGNIAYGYVDSNGTVYGP